MGNVRVAGVFPDTKSGCPQMRTSIIESLEIVGHSQIAAVFSPEYYEQVIYIHGYNRIRKYYLQPGNYDTDDKAELRIFAMKEKMMIN